MDLSGHDFQIDACEGLGTRVCLGHSRHRDQRAQVELSVCSHDRPAYSAPAKARSSLMYRPAFSGVTARAGRIRVAGLPSHLPVGVPVTAEIASSTAWAACSAGWFRPSATTG